MMLCLQPYDLIAQYVPGKIMYLADTLSRAYLTAERADDCVGLEHDLEYVVHTVIQNLPVATSKLTEFKEATALDFTLQTVVLYRQHEWPRSQKNVPVNCRKYRHIRDSLYKCDGILFFGDCIIVPLQLGLKC